MTAWEVTLRIHEFLDTGGAVVYVLLAMSIFAMAVILLKLYQFHRVRIGARGSAGEALRLHRSGQSARALDLLACTPNPVAEVLALAIRGYGRSDLDPDTVREEVARAAAHRLTKLRSFLRPLEVIGSVAPLLGLFGTVLGMIEAFRQLEQAGMQVNPAVLSGGIWEALLTTAVGLAVAIPTVVFSSWLERRVERVADDMEDAISGAFTVDLDVPVGWQDVTRPAPGPAAHETLRSQAAD